MNENFLMSNNLENLVQKAEELFELEKFQEIIELLTDEVLEKYKDARLYAWRARSHSRLSHDSDLIMSYAERAISIAPNYFMGYIIRGNIWGNKGKYDKAIDDFTKAIELKRDYFLAHHNRGYWWKSKGEDDKAIADFTKAIELNPVYKDAYTNRGFSWDSKGEYDKAIADYTKAIELKPDDEDAYYNRGISWKSKGENDKAIADFTKAIELKPDDESAYYNRGVSWNSKREYDKAIADYTKAIELKPDYEEVYNNRGISWNSKGEYDKALADYTKAIELKPDYAIAYINRGSSWNQKGEFDNAIADYTKGIEFKPDNAIAYYNRGNSWNYKGEYDKAIADYTKAIKLNPEYSEAYFNRGYTRKNNRINLDKCIEDFEQYLRLISIKDDLGVIVAKYHIQELREKIADTQLIEIGNITSEIKKLLLIRDGCITHYTSLTTTKILLLEENSRFRISEGAFLNDTSEGTELFKFLNKQFSKANSDGLVAETFAPKPFIGSFVAEEKHDDLNLWRFYGKENGTEAKGCAITIRIDDFIKAINRLLTEGHEKQGTNIESDISFYKVAYWDHNSKELNVIIPNSSNQDEKKLKELIQNLKTKVKEYKQEDRSILEKYLNSIAFLFKSDVYKNENEIRLVIKGIEFKKNIDREISPPRVYIDLVNIRHLIKQITLGPKVDKSDEWAAAFHYSYDRDTVEAPKILISRLPFK